MVTSPYKHKNMPGKNGAALMDAIKNNDLEGVNALLIEGADVNYQDQEAKGDTIMTLLAFYNHVEITKEILAIDGVDPNKTNSSGDTPLICATFFGSNDIALLLIKDPRVDINIQNNNQNTALDVAMANENVEVITALSAEMGIKIVGKLTLTNGNTIKLGNGSGLGLPN